jgi:3-keto-5-aminohexanoate cleavage enzyme
MRKVIITVAVTGGQHGKEANRNLPVHPDEIADSVLACYNEGAAIAHMHARDKGGRPCGDRDIFLEIKEKVVAKCDIIQNFSTGGGPNLTNEERIASAFADPEICSLNMGSLIRNDGGLFLNPPNQIKEWAGILKSRGIKAEMEVYSHSMFNEVQELIEKEMVSKPYLINLVLGMRRQSALPATEKHLLSMFDFLPGDCVFNVTAVGRMQLPLTTLGVLLGGNIRVGLEDNVYYSKGVLATNEQLVARSARIIKELGFGVASVDEAREILRLKRQL